MLCKKNRSGSDKKKGGAGGMLLLSSFAFIRKQVVLSSMDQLSELQDESPEAATRRTMHSQGRQSRGGLLQ